MDVCVDDILASWAKRAKKPGFSGANKIAREDFVKDLLISIPFSDNFLVQPRYKICLENLWILSCMRTSLPKCPTLICLVPKLSPTLICLVPLIRGFSFLFVRYDGEKLVESYPSLVHIASDRNGVQEVFEKLYRIFMLQDSLVQDMVAKQNDDEEVE